MDVLTEEIRSKIKADSKLQRHLTVISGVNQRAIEIRLTEQRKTSPFCTPTILRFISQWLKIDEVYLFESIEE